MEGLHTAEDNRLVGEDMTCLFEGKQFTLSVDYRLDVPWKIRDAIRFCGRRVLGYE